MPSRLPQRKRDVYGLTLHDSASTFVNVTPTCSPYATLPGVAHTPRKASVLWPDEQAGPWCVTVWWRVQFGVPTPVGLALTSWWGAGVHEREDLPAGDAEVAFPPVEGVLLRKLPMTELLERTRTLVYEDLARQPRGRGLHQDELRAATDEILTDTARELTPFAIAALHFAADSETTQQLNDSLDEQTRALQTKRGNRDLGDDHYRQVAVIYADAVQNGRPPTQAVARWLAGESANDPDIVKSMKSAAAKKVSRARQRGFLPKTTRGRTGHLTEEP